MRRLSEALLLALLLFAVQTAALTHAHADEAPSPGSTVQGCDYCVGHSASAPAPEVPAAVRPTARATAAPAAAVTPPATRRFPSGHRSRAPPIVRSP